MPRPRVAPRIPTTRWRITETATACRARFWCSITSTTCRSGAAGDSVYGPGSWNWDVGVQKLIAITEQHRLQVRADFLDAFNHFNLGVPSATIADTRDGGLPNATAGKIFGGSGNRIVQLGLKYVF